MRLQVLFTGSINPTLLEDIVNDHEFVRISTDYWDDIDFSGCEFIVGMAVEGDNVIETIHGGQRLYDRIDMHWGHEYPAFYLILLEPHSEEEFYTRFEQWGQYSGDPFESLDVDDDNNMYLHIASLQTLSPSRLAEIPSAAEDFGRNNLRGGSNSLSGFMFPWTNLHI